MVEVYLKAMVRDIPFANFGFNPKFKWRRWSWPGWLISWPSGQLTVFRVFSKATRLGHLFPSFCTRIFLRHENIDQKYSAIRLAKTS